MKRPEFQQVQRAQPGAVSKLYDQLKNAARERRELVARPSRARDGTTPPQPDLNALARAAEDAIQSARAREHEDREAAAGAQRRREEAVRAARLASERAEAERRAA
ncbi:MAG TPA: hypothetical protein VFP44_17785, partial [Usitatibacter sp.]|nr:hypothetical protein [Usitatibacter sp.]